jgi:hypothetical protein
MRGFINKRGGTCRAPPSDATQPIKNGTLPTKHTTHTCPLFMNRSNASFDKSGVTTTRKFGSEKAFIVNGALVLSCWIKANGKITQTESLSKRSTGTTASRLSLRFF